MAKKGEEVPVKSKKQPAASEKADAKAGAQAITRHDPWSVLRGEIDDVFDRFTAGWPRMFDFDPFERLGMSPRPSADLSPRVDVGEDEKAYEISAELPGLEEKDVEVTLDDGVLVLKGEKKQENEREGKDWHVSERSFGSFQRRFRLPDDVEADKINASFKQGVLKVSLPRAKKAKDTARRITIDAS